MGSNSISRPTSPSTDCSFSYAYFVSRLCFYGCAITFYLIGLKYLLSSIIYAAVNGFSEHSCIWQPCAKVSTSCLDNFWMWTRENLFTAVLYFVVTVAFILTILYLHWLVYARYLYTVVLFQSDGGQSDIYRALTTCFFVLMWWQSDWFPLPLIGGALCKYVYGSSPFRLVTALSLKSHGSTLLDNTCRLDKQEREEALEMLEVERWCDLLLQGFDGAADTTGSLTGTISGTVTNCLEKPEEAHGWDAVFKLAVCSINGLLFSPNDMSVAKTPQAYAPATTSVMEIVDILPSPPRELKSTQTAILLLFLMLFGCALGTVVIAFRRVKRKAKTSHTIVLPATAANVTPRSANATPRSDEHSWLSAKTTLTAKCSELAVCASNTLIKTVSSMMSLSAAPSLVRTVKTYVTEIVHRACHDVATSKPTEVRNQKSGILQNNEQNIHPSCQSHQSMPLERSSLSSKTSKITPKSSRSKDNVMLTIDLERDVSGNISSAAVGGYPLDVESIRRLKKFIDEQQETKENQRHSGSYIDSTDKLSATSRAVIQNVVDVVLKYYREQREGNHSKSEQKLKATWCDKIELSEFNEKLEFVERLLQEEGNESLFGLTFRAQKDDEDVTDHQNVTKCEYVLTYNGECPIKKTKSDRLSGHHENSSSLTNAPHVKRNRVSIVFDECGRRDSVTSSTQQNQLQDNDINLAVSLHKDEENKISSATIQGHLVNVHSILRLQEFIEEKRNGLASPQTLDSCAEGVVLDLLKSLCDETATNVVSESHQDTHTLKKIISSIESNRSIKTNKPSGTGVKCITAVTYQEPDPESAGEQKVGDASDLFNTLNIQEVVQEKFGEVNAKTNISVTFLTDESVKIERMSHSEAKVAHLRPTTDMNPSSQEVITDSGTHVDNFVFTVNLQKDVNGVISSASVGRHPLSLESILHLQELLEQEQNTTIQTRESLAELPAALRAAARQVVQHVIDAVLLSVHITGETPHSSFHRLQNDAKIPTATTRRQSLFGQKLETINRVLTDATSKETLTIVHGDSKFHVGELSIHGLPQKSKTPKSAHPNVFNELIIRDSLENVIDGATQKTNISLVFAIEDNAAVFNSNEKINISNSEKHLNINTSNSSAVLQKHELSHTVTKSDSVLNSAGEDVKNFVFCLNVDRDAKGNIGSVSVSSEVSDLEQFAVCTDSHVLDVTHFVQLEEEIKSYTFPGKSDMEFLTNEWCHAEASLREAARHVIQTVIDAVLPTLLSGDGKKVTSHHDVASINALKSVSQIMRGSGSGGSINLKYSDLPKTEQESKDVLKHLVIQEMIAVHESKWNQQANISLIFNVDGTMPPKRRLSGKHSQHKRPSNEKHETKNSSRISSITKSSTVQQSKSELIGTRSDGNENDNSSSRHVNHDSCSQSSKITQVSSGKKNPVKATSKSILKKDSAKASKTGDGKQKGMKKTSFSEIKVTKQSASKSSFSQQGSMSSYSEDSSLDILPMYSQQVMHVKANKVAKEIELESQGHAVSVPTLLQKDSDSDDEIDAEINVTPVPSVTRRIMGEDRQGSPSSTRPKSRRGNHSREEMAVKGSMVSKNSVRAQVVRKGTSEELNVNVNTNATPGGDVIVKPASEGQRTPIKFGRDQEREWIAIYKRRLKNKRELKMKMGHKADWKI